MQSLEAKSFFPAQKVAEAATIRRLLWQGPVRLVFSIVLVFVAAGLYTIFPFFHSHDILYICVLLGFFVAFVWGFEDLLGGIERRQRNHAVEPIPHQELYVKPSQVPYTREEWNDLLNDLSAHRHAVHQEYPVLFERFREEAGKRAILIVQDEQPAAELLKKAFRDFGFSVLVITSPEADHRMIDCAEQADLVVWDALLSNARHPFEKLVTRPAIEGSQEHEFRGMRILTASAITRRPDVVRRTFESWLSDYPETFADAFFWHLFEAAAAIPKAKAFSASVGTISEASNR